VWFYVDDLIEFDDQNICVLLARVVRGAFDQVGDRKPGRWRA